MARKASGRAVVAPVQEPAPGPGKGRATPSRREQEQARRKPLVPTDRKAAARASRADSAADRNRARIGMANGEERYLPLKDRGPQRRFARDHVDATYRAGELLYPLFGVLFLLTIVFSTAQFQTFFYIGLIALLALFIGDGLLVARRIRRRLAERHGADQVERGLNYYVVTRSLQPRPLRMPKPQVKRGQRPA